MRLTTHTLVEKVARSAYNVACRNTNEIDNPQAGKAAGSICNVETEMR